MKSFNEILEAQRYETKSFDSVNSARLELQGTTVFDKESCGYL